jgi:FKBP12-rapamycin complex-associated protein
LNEKVGGILAIRELINCTSASAESKVIKFAETLSASLEENKDFNLIELIAQALGYMARYSPVSHVDYVEAELIRSLSWLKESPPHRRFAGCTVLRQLAENAPTVFFVRVKEFFDLIWDPLWDSKDTIRFAASKALSACLAVLSQRTYHLQWYCGLYDRIHDGLRKGTAESVHGSLLVVSESLKLTGDFMVPRFKEVCKAIMQFKDHRSRIVKGAIIHLLPSLAQFCPDSFARTHLDEAMDMLLKCCKSQETKADALLSTGQLCRALGPHLVNRVDELLELVKDAFLTGSKKQRADVAAEALQCVADMVCGLGAPFHDRVLILLEPMLQCGLTEQLIDTLIIIGKYIPLQKVVVQQRLLEEATKILGGQPKQKMDFSWKRKRKSSTIPKNISGMIKLQSSSTLTQAPSVTTLSSYSGNTPKQVAINFMFTKPSTIKETR